MIEKLSNYLIYHNELKMVQVSLFLHLAVWFEFLILISIIISVIEAPGEIYDGSFQKTKKEPSQGFIVYEPDSADDMDDEEPDDEL